MEKERKVLLPQSFTFPKKTPFFPRRPTLLSHQSLPKNGYEPRENVNFRRFSTFLPILHKSRPPPIKLYIPSIIFSEPKQTSKASPSPLLHLKRFPLSLASQLIIASLVDYEARIYS
ncbi:hypothetical protein H5410_041580 [Solanum commersonii]|uniref:Uncharacterized protein n=1 Tax=Solanum commersonii TaxID=4109 RepID=A0A9J5XTH7_SOLCO|nr:hypothetical protein H5410_041580 [Solanum commersonii]